MLDADKKENEAAKEEKHDEVKQSDEVKDHETKQKQSKREVADNGDNGENSVEMVKKKKVLDADKKETEAAKEEKHDEVNEKENEAAKEESKKNKKEPVVKAMMEDNSEEDFENPKRPVRKSTRIAQGKANRKNLVDDLAKLRAKKRQERKKLVKPFIRDEAPETNRIPTGYYGPHTGENTPTIRAEQMEVTKEEFWSENSESNDDGFKKNRIESDDEDGFELGDDTFRANITNIVASLSESDELDMSLLNTTPPEDPKRTIGIGRKKIRKNANGEVEYDTELNKELDKFKKDADTLRKNAGIYSDDDEDGEDSEKDDVQPSETECDETKHDEKTECEEIKHDGDSEKDAVQPSETKSDETKHDKKTERDGDSEKVKPSETECDETKHDEKTERDGDSEKVKPSETECDETKHDEKTERDGDGEKE